MAEQVRKTVEDQWKEFSAAVFDINLVYPKRQVQEMKRAFFGGASAMFFLMTSGLDEGMDPTPEDIAYVDSLFKELEKFKNDMIAGLT